MESNPSSIFLPSFQMIQTLGDDEKVKPSKEQLDQTRILAQAQLRSAYQLSDPKIRFVEPKLERCCRRFNSAPPQRNRIIASHRSCKLCRCRVSFFFSHVVIVQSERTSAILAKRSFTWKFQFELLTFETFEMHTVNGPRTTSGMCKLSSKGCTYRPQNSSARSRMLWRLIGFGVF